MVKAVIFDLDDTLIPEKQYIESGYHHISRFLSNKLNKDEEVLFQTLLNLFIESPKNVFNRLLDKFEVSYTKESIMELVEEYRNHIPVIEFFDDVLPCLKSLKKRDVKVGIITDGYANSQKKKLNAVRAYDHFSKIIITDELGREYWKPHPRAFEMMKEKLNVEFNELVYVGDNPEKDFYISKIYPVKTVRIQREGVYKGKSYLDSIKESYSIYSLKEIDVIFNRNKLNITSSCKNRCICCKS